MDDADFPAVLAAAKQGDDAAFRVLFRAAQPATLRYLRALAPGRADDLAAETWLQVVRGLDEFEAERWAAFRSWVLAIARHRLLDDYRARGRRPEVLTDAVPEPAAAPAAESAAGEVMSTEAAIALLRRLPRDQAEVLILRVVADLDVASTAEIMGKEPGTVRVLAHRGLKRLRSMLEQGDHQQV